MKAPLNWPTVVVAVALIAALALAMFLRAPEAVVTLLGIIGVIIGVASPLTKAQARTQAGAEPDATYRVAVELDTAKAETALERLKKKSDSIGVGEVGAFALAFVVTFAVGLVVLACTPRDRALNPDGTERTAADHAAYGAAIALCDAKAEAPSWGARGRDGDTNADGYLSDNERCELYVQCRDSAAKAHGRPHGPSVYWCEAPAPVPAGVTK